ncbi:MAG TPA: hypothetical protein VFN67_09095 [Polyangiales bacterium]|nr:hypothetical protein [Polyangiales bacterium]
MSSAAFTAGSRHAARPNTPPAPKLDASESLTNEGREARLLSSLRANTDLTAADVRQLDHLGPELEQYAGQSNRRVRWSRCTSRATGTKGAQSPRITCQRREERPRNLRVRVDAPTSTGLGAVNALLDEPALPGERGAPEPALPVLPALGAPEPAPAGRPATGIEPADEPPAPPLGRPAFVEAGELPAVGNEPATLAPEPAFIAGAPPVAGLPALGTGLVIATPGFVAPVTPDVPAAAAIDGGTFATPALVMAALPLCAWLDVELLGRIKHSQGFHVPDTHCV